MHRDRLALDIHDKGNKGSISAALRVRAVGSEAQRRRVQPGRAGGGGQVSVGYRAMAVVLPDQTRKPLGPQPTPLMASLVCSAARPVRSISRRLTRARASPRASCAQPLAQ